MTEIRGHKNVIIIKRLKDIKRVLYYMKYENCSSSRNVWFRSEHVLTFVLLNLKDMQIFNL